MVIVMFMVMDSPWHCLGTEKVENSYKSIIFSVFSIIFADKLDIIDAKNLYLNGFWRNLVIVMFMVMDSPWHCLGTEKVGKLLQIDHFFRFFNHIRRQTRYN